MVIAGVILVITAWQFITIPERVSAGESIRASLNGYTLAPQGISFDAMKEHQDELDKVLMADPNRKGFFSSLGTVGGSSNSGFIFMHLKSPSERPEIPSATMTRLVKEYGSVPVVGSVLRATAPLFRHHPDINEVLQELRAKLVGIPGLAVYLRNPPPIQIGGQVTNSPYQVTLQSPDTEELYRVAHGFEQKMENLPALQDVTSDLQINNPQVNVNIDRDKASALGIYGRIRSKTRSIPPTASGRFDHLRAQRRIPGDHGSRSRSTGRSRRALAAVRPRAQGANWSRSNTIAQLAAHLGAARESTIRPASPRSLSRSIVGPASRSAKRSTT